MPFTKKYSEADICTAPGCNKPVKIKGFCIPHYKVFHRLGTPIASRPCIHEPIEVKFWMMVDKNSGDGCWLWKGGKDKDGYGNVRDGKKMKKAHRVAWELNNGPIPEGLRLRHTCNNPPCCRPSHLIPGDHLANMADRLTAGNYPTGQRHPNSKLTNKQTAEIKASNETGRALAKRFGVSESQIGNIRHGRQRKNL